MVFSMAHIWNRERNITDIPQGLEIFRPGFRNPSLLFINIYMCLLLPVEKKRIACSSPIERGKDFNGVEYKNPQRFQKGGESNCALRDWHENMSTVEGWRRNGIPMKFSEHTGFRDWKVLQMALRLCQFPDLKVLRKTEAWFCKTWMWSEIHRMSIPAFRCSDCLVSRDFLRWYTVTKHFGSQSIISFDAVCELRRKEHGQIKIRIDETSTKTHFTTSPSIKTNSYDFPRHGHTGCLCATLRDQKGSHSNLKNIKGSWRICIVPNKLSKYPLETDIISNPSSDPCQLCDLIQVYLISFLLIFITIKWR